MGLTGQRRMWEHGTRGKTAKGRRRRKNMSRPPRQGGEKKKTAQDRRSTKQRGSAYVSICLARDWSTDSVPQHRCSNVGITARLCPFSACGESANHPASQTAMPGTGEADAGTARLEATVMPAAGDARGERQRRAAEHEPAGDCQCCRTALGCVACVSCPLLRH